MSNTEIIGLLAAILTTVAFIPQAFKALRYRDTRSLSLGMYVIFTAGVALWAAALILISTSTVYPVFVRVTGTIAAILFAITAARIFYGTQLTPLSQPLPFHAYPFFALTLFGWAWVHVRSSSRDVARDEVMARASAT